MPDTHTARDALVAAIAGSDAAPALHRIATERANRLYDAVRTEAVAEAADAIDEVADAAEEDAIASYGYAYGRSNRTVAIHREDAALLRRLAAAPTTPTTKEK